MSTRPPTQDDSAGGWSDPGEPGVAATERAHEGPRYALGAVLGEGGMGVVHAARDQALGRDVALKELQHARAADPSARARLAREAAITSRLDHPGIVAVHDAGTLPDGRPYYTMRLVRGRSLADATRGADPAARRGLLRHVLAAAEAVAAAHDAGIVHRDLKPQNILVGAHGETQVVDWGLAAPTQAAEPRWSGLPGASARGPVGTDRYMSPEQRRGAPPDLRDDVYSLGVTIREVLGSPDAELAAIVARACASDAAARYADAGALADDLLAWFEGRRVGAHAYSPGELLRRAAHAYRLPLGVGAAGLAAVVVAAGIGWGQTAATLDRALRAEVVAGDRLAEVQLEQAVEATRAGQRERAERLALAVLERRDDPVARGVFAAFGRAERPALVHAEAAPSCTWAVLADAARWSLCANATGISRHEDSAVRWTRSGAWLGADLHGDVVLAWDTDSTLTALDAASGTVLASWPRQTTDWRTIGHARMLWAGDGPLDPTGLPPSGCEKRLQVGTTRADGRMATMCDDGTLYLGDADDPGRDRVATAATGEHVATALAWTVDGGLLIGTVRGRVFHLDGEGTLRSSADTDLGLLSDIVVSTDGRHAGLRGAGGRVGLWRIDSGTLLAELDGDAHTMAFDGEGLVVHTRGTRSPPRRHTWRIPGGAPAVVGAAAGLADVATSPDGAAIAIAGGDGFTAVVDLRSGEMRAARLGSRVVKAAAFGPDGAWFTGLDAPRFARAAADGAWVAAAEPRALRRLAVLADGALFGPDLDDGVYHWPRPELAPRRLASGRTFVDMELADGQPLLVDNEGGVTRWDGAAFVEVGAYADVRAVAGHRGVVYRATADTLTDGTRRFDAPGATFLDLAVSPDGRRLAAGTLDGRVYVWDTRTGDLLLLLAAHHERAVAVEFLPDGDLVSASWDRTARIADLAAIDAPVGELAAAVRAAWSADEGAVTRGE